MNLQFIYQLTRKILTILLNQILYAGDGLGIQSGTVRLFLFRLKPYLKILLLVIYIFWFVLASLFQILFHYIPLSIERTNIIVLLYILLCILTILNHHVSNDFRAYAVTSNLSFKQKKRLIIMNEYIGIILTWGFIFLFSLPFIIMQTILNGINGFLFMGQALLGLLYVGFIIGFLRFCTYVFRERYINLVNKFLLPLFYIFICILLSIYQTYAVSFLSTIFHNILYGKMVGWIENLTVLSKFNLYELRINLTGYIVIMIGILICSSLLHIFSEKMCIEKENPSHFMDYSIFKKYFIYIYINVSREYGIVNTNFMLAYIGTLFGLTFSASFGVQTVNVSFLAAYMLIVLYLNQNIVQTILFCKRHNGPIKYTAVMLSVPLLVQFTLIITILCLTKTMQFDRSIIKFFLFGSTLMICSLFLYVRSVYRLESLLDEKFFKKIGKGSIVLLFLSITSVQILLRGFGIFGTVFSFFVSILLVSGVSIWIIDKISRIRGVRYD